MANLSAADMKKETSAGAFAGHTRTQIFQHKCKLGSSKKEGNIGAISKKVKPDNDYFLVGTTKAYGVSYNPITQILSYVISKSSKKVLTAPRSKIAKDSDLGGGGKGSGGGSDLTKYVESMQCYYCSLAFNVVPKGEINTAGKNPVGKKCANTANLKEAAKFVDASESYANCKKNGPKDWLEIEAYTRLANAIYKKYKSKVSGNVRFHRDSNFMKGIYEAKKKCHDIDKNLGTKSIAPLSFHPDKWNPGDIWMESVGATEKPLVEEKFYKTWPSLNAEVQRLAKKGDVLGISLKKPSNTGSVKVDIYNDIKKGYSKNIKYVGYRFGQTGDFFSSIDIYILITVDGVPHEFQFRPFSSIASWQGEVSAAAAKAGKISGGPVNFYLQDFNKKMWSGINDNGEAELYNAIKQKTFASTKGWDLFETYCQGSKKIQTPFQVGNYITKTIEKEKLGKTLDKSSFTTLWNKQKDSFKFGKYCGLTLIDQIHSTPELSSIKRNKLMVLFFRYASSATEQSSYFIKAH